MDHARGLRRTGAHRHGPGANFLLAGGEVSLQAEKREGRADQPCEAGFGLAHLGQEHRLVFLLHVGQLGFGLGADGDHRRALGLGVGTQSVEIGVVLEAVLGHVGDEHRRLGRDQAERLDKQLLLPAEGDRAHRLALVELGHAFGEHVGDLLGFLVARARDLVVAVQPLLDGAHVGQAELGLDHLDVGDRVDLASHVDHVLVVEAAHDVDDGVGLADVGEELVAEAFTLRGAGHQPCDVDELDNRRHDLFGRDDRRQLLQPRVGQLDDADVRLDGAERIVLGRDAGLGEGIEEGGLADVRQAHDAAFEAHEGVFGAGSEGGV